MTAGGVGYNIVLNTDIAEKILFFSVGDSATGQVVGR